MYHMAMKCENCLKGIMYGHNVSHSKRRTNRVFKPNLHFQRVIVDGRSQRIKLCTKCVRLLKNPPAGRQGRAKASVSQAIASQALGTHL